MDGLKIYGFTGEINNIEETLKYIKDLNKDHDCLIQLIDADFIAGKKHIRHGVFQAINSFKRSENIANDLSVEIILRLSAQRQISKAFDILGLKNGKMNLCVIISNCSNEILNALNNNFSRDDDVLSPNILKLKNEYNISDEELAIIDIEDIIIDKITKLNVDY
ncbi:MAG: KEOPS complex subunit Cgi121 [Methanobacteriaceae archaeon]|jgi:KEOPS complex subunit Cgi121|nr:KEOPS complex subunit Cgi121 [Methanobacteriaceae archaeon]